MGRRMALAALTFLIMVGISFWAEATRRGGLHTLPSLGGDEPRPYEDLRPRPSSTSLSINSATSVILMDRETGRTLFERNAKERRPPASTTKIMTAVLILERGRLHEKVRVGEQAASVGGFSLGLKPGQMVSLKDLLAAILVGSANDAAMAAAEHIAGSKGRFVSLMNAKATQLGMKDTHFANPHGLDEDGHYSTAYDLALLARYALQNPSFARLVKSRRIQVTIMNGRTRRVVRRKVLKTHNRLLDSFWGADGVKTGYTEAAGPSLVASARRGDRGLIAVLLNDPHRFTDAASLLEYGFRHLLAERREFREKG